jgi:hypothetical protein
MDFAFSVDLVPGGVSAESHAGRSASIILMFLNFVFAISTFANLNLRVEASNIRAKLEGALLRGAPGNAAPLCHNAPSADLLAKTLWKPGRLPPFRKSRPISRQF